MNKINPAFSIVVPIYNVEQYLCDCVASIRRQTLENIEIILVDDGSPDRCGELAESFASQDNRIKVVHRFNGGLGPARNTGIDVACGEYIGFVDSDDWVEPEMYERLYNAAVSEDADIVFTGMKSISHGVVNCVREHPFSGATLNGDEEILPLRAAFYGAPPSRVSDDPTPVSVCLAGYRRSFLQANRLRFLNVRSEDKFFNTHACRLAKSVTCIDGTPYCYRKDDQPSITKTFNRKTTESFFRLFRLLEQMAEDETGAAWDQCHLREQRCIVDYCRVLLGMIENSGSEENAKLAFAKEVISHPVLLRACTSYPWWDLPFQQAVFFVAVKTHSARLVRSLVRLKGRC